MEPRLPALTKAGPSLPLQGISRISPLSSRGSKPFHHLLGGGDQILSLLFYLLVAIAIGKYHLGREKMAENEMVAQVTDVHALSLASHLAEW